MCPMFADQTANNRQDLLTREKPKNRHPRRDIWEARDWSNMPLTGLMIKQKIVTIRIVYGIVQVIFFALILDSNLQVATNE